MNGTEAPVLIYARELRVDVKECNLNVGGNKTRFGGYEGIPENILINLVIWLIVMGTFTVLRKNCWNYGRLALLREANDDRVTQQCYKQVGAPDTSSICSQDSAVQIDQGYFCWIPAIFRISEEQVVKRRGEDAAQYLSFQRHIIGYMAIVCVISLTVALPINFQGQLEGGEADFGHTTMANLRPESPFMWAHVTLAFLFLPLGILFMWQFSKRLRKERGSTYHTLMISRVPRAACFKDNIMTHFAEAYPELEVKNVEFAYNVNSLISSNKAREEARTARLYCEKYLEDKKKRLEVRPYTCGNVCRCCRSCGCPSVDAIEFYTSEEGRLCEEVETERVKSLQRPTGVAFLTLATSEAARQVLKDHHHDVKCASRAPTSSVSRLLKPHNWFIWPAPPPNDIYWANLSVTNRMWWPKAIVINIILFMVLFLFTTPALIMNNLNIVLSGAMHKINDVSPVIEEFLATLLLIGVASTMPVIVAYSDRLMSHWTRSAENHSIMVKTFTFLLFMVVILPSLGLTSARGLAEWLVTQNHKNETFRWECIFLPDNGAFFVNYIITSAFIGTSFELVRIPQLLMLVVGLCMARSKAETASVRRAVLTEFPFGVQYAWMLLIFAMTIIYSVSCPLITPFGTLFLVMKHLVDKYNIYFAYNTSYINVRIHTTAINFVLVSIACLQLSLLFFSLVRQGVRHARTIYSIFLLVVTGVVFLTQNIFHWINPSAYKHITEADSSTIDRGSDNVSDTDSRESGDVASQFVPSVLRDPPCGIELSHVTQSPLRNYGTLRQETRTEERGEEESSFSEESEDSSHKRNSLQPQAVTTEAEINDPSVTPPSSGGQRLKEDSSNAPDSFC